MSDSSSNISRKAGMPPGALIHVGEVFDADSTIFVIDWSNESIEERTVQSVDEILRYKGQGTVTWVDIEGLKNIELVEAVGRAFNIHPLVLEDILNTHQRPKFEEYDDYLYIVMKVVSLEGDELSPNYEQVSVLVLSDFVFTFKERKDDVFLPINRRIKNNRSQLRSLGSDYLAYTILDTIVDLNFSLLDSFDEKLDSIEDELLTDPTPQTLVDIQRIKRELINIRRNTSPLRELLGAILRSESELIHEKTHMYFRDVYDHAIRITEAIELHRDMMSGLLDIYISSVSNKMNEVMKVLTVFMSVFVPLTFIAGIYGMNFEYMPELGWKWSYPVLWLGFIATSLVLLAFFKKKKWL